MSAKREADTKLRQAAVRSERTLERLRSLELERESYGADEPAEEKEERPTLSADWREQCAKNWPD